MVMEQFSKRELFKTPDLMLESDMVEQLSSFLTGKLEFSELYGKDLKIL